MTSKSKQKGDRFERQMVQTAQMFGLKAEKVPLSGAVKTESFDTDVIIEGEKFECKSRKSGFKLVYDYLADNYGLFIKQDRTEPLLVMKASDFMHLIGNLKFAEEKLVELLEERE